jgi:single-strand DNA-binding protein
MLGINKVILLGNLGKDPEVRYLENERVRASFPLATNEASRNKEGEKIISTEWHNIVLWTPLAKIAEKHLKKGSQIYIEGKITSRSYTDKEGQIKYATEIVGQNVLFLGEKKGDKSGEKNSPSSVSVGTEAEKTPGLSLL